MKNELPMIRYVCPKCGGKEYRLKGIRVMSSPFSEPFDILSRRYSAMICTRCRYTELYNVPLRKMPEVYTFLGRA